jgi:hypothetical protein
MILCGGAADRAGALVTDEMLLSGPFSQADATAIRQQILG